MSIIARIRIIASRIRGVLLSKSLERELQAEIRIHLEMQVDENLRSGMDLKEARSAAMRKFGGIDQVREKHRERRGLPFLETTLQDLRYAVRLMRKNLSFTVVAILTLSIGIGANTAIFSIIEAVVLRPLPYKDSDRLVTLTKVNEVKWRLPFQYSIDFQTLKSENQSFEDLAVYYENESSRSNVTFTEDQERQTVKAGLVSGNFLPLMGVSPVIGRFFTADEDAQEQKLTLISYGLWQRRFGGSPNAIGQMLQLDGENFQIIGIMPAEFHMPAAETQMWIPINSRKSWLDDRERTPNWSIIGRLKTGQNLSQVQAEVATIESRIKAIAPSADKWRLDLSPLGSGLNSDTSRALFVLFGAVLFVLLIACANVGCLLTARSAVRVREMALRASLGASRTRLFRQILTEGLMLSLVSALFGLILAAWGIRLLSIFGPRDIPRIDETHINPAVLLFTIAASVLAALVFGLVPAWKISRSEANDVLRSGSKGSVSIGAMGRVRDILIIGEFAITLILLTGSGLMIRSFFAVKSVNLGFRPDHTITLNVSLPDAAAYEEVIKRISADSRVTSVGCIRDLFEVGQSRNLGLRAIEGRDAEPRDQWTPLNWVSVGGNYFQAMGAELLKGRYFSDDDTKDTALVAIIDEAAANRYWPGQNPIGKRFKGQDKRGKNDDWDTVIGLVRNLRRQGLEKEPTPHIFEWSKQSGDKTNTIIVRTTTDPLTLSSDLRSIAHAVSLTAVVSKVSTLEDELGDQIRQRRFQTWVLGMFSMVALLLSTIGIFGLMRYAVAQRTNEIGIRMALGAQGGDVLRLILRQGFVLTAIGVAIGLACAFVLTRLMASLLYGTSATDPVTFLSVTTGLIIVSFIASYLPARRATKVDPMIALRYE